MSDWFVAFVALLVWHLASGFVSGRLIYWQRRHIDTLKESARLDAALRSEEGSTDGCGRA